MASGGSVAVAIALALSTGCSSAPPNGERPIASAAPTASTGAGPTATRERVVIALVIDQLPMWMAIERWKTLPSTGGFAKLLTEANGIVELHHGHAQNSTAPGHAALFSGATPHDSGVTANARLDEKGEHGSSLADASANVVTAAGVEKRTGSSIASLKVPAIADALRKQRPDATIIALSMKDRGAIFGGGQKPTATLWYDSAADAFVTTTAFASEVPAWAKTFATIGAGARYRDKPWLPLDPKWLATHSDLPAPDIGQGDYAGLGVKFPHDVANAAKPAKAFVATPFADTMLVDAAIAAIDDAATKKGPALIAISLSSNDYVGHIFGPDAPEAWDQMLRLDGELARLLGHLDQKLGPGGYGVVLSADHGVPPTPEVMNQGFCGRPDADRFERRCERAIRMHEKELARIAEDAADKAAGKGDWVLGVSEPFVVFRPATRELPKEKLDPIVAAVMKAFSSIPGIARTVDVRAMPAQCPAATDESIDALLCRSIRGTTGGDIFIVAKPGSFIDTEYVGGDGVNHGTPYLFDRAVPLIVRAPRAAAPKPVEISTIALDGRTIVDQRAYAASIAGLLGIAPPDAAVGGKDLSTAVVR